MILMLWSTIAQAQGRLVMNGAYINLHQGANLVIENPSPNAITMIDGAIISESQNNVVKWYIGTTAGTYTIPFRDITNSYLPLTFTKTSGTGSGYFLFSTYHTGWQNSSQLPSGVASFNGSNGIDNSAFASDRFWQINAQGYTLKPVLSNLVLPYLDAENTASGNTINESGLRAKRYNNDLDSWTDNLLMSTANTTANTVTVASVDVANLYAWWVVGTLGANRYWVAPSHSTSNLTANWSDTPGGPGNTSLPTQDDVVIFDGTSDANCTISGTLNALSLNVASGFTGIISQGANTINVIADATFSGGTFTGGSSPINVGGNFDISGTAFTSTSSTLDIKGNFNASSGTFVHNGGTVSFSSTAGATQTISSTSALTFNNITVSNRSALPGVSIESNENMAGTLTLASSVSVDADGSSDAAIFKLLSTGDNPTKDAAIATLPAGAQVLGNVTVQRFMALEGPNKRIYRYIASPVQQGTVRDLQQEIPVTGTFIGATMCLGCISSSPSLFYYNESVITDTNGDGTNTLNDGYVDFPDAVNTEYFTPARGYALYIRGNLLKSALWDLRGVINSGNVTPISFPVSYTSSGTAANDGWNLVGNPYPSTIDWNAPTGWTKTNVGASIYVPDNGSSSALQFATWNGVTGTNGGSRYIAMGQGFWVTANGMGTPFLQANENVKAAGTQTIFFREEQPSNLLRMTLVKGTDRDETVIHFRSDASDGFDSHADADKFPNATFNLSSSLSDGKKMAINSMAALNCTSTIPVNIDNASAGNYRLDFSSLESFPSPVTFTLTDKFLGTSHDIRSKGSYSFSVTSNPGSYGSGRFKISVTTPVPNADFTLQSNDVCDGSGALITIDNAQAGALYSAIIGSVSIPAVEQNGVMSIELPKENLQQGENKIIVESKVEFCDLSQQKEVTLQVISSPVPVVTSAKRCGEGSVTLTASGGAHGGHYNWYEDEWSSKADETQHDSLFVTPSLRKSKTYYVSTVNKAGCESEKAAAQVMITFPEPVAITLHGNELVSDHPSGNQWYFNGEIIDGANGVSIEPHESGTYGVQLLTEGCITSATYEYVIAEIEENYKKISVSPNPVRQEALLEIPDTFIDLREVRIINSVGQYVGTVTMQKEEGRKTGKLQFNGLPPGLYIVQVVSEKGVEEIKVIKE
jgi:hypothetical protein